MNPPTSFAIPFRRCAGDLPGALVPVGAARADWLVLRDGVRVETKGPWTVKGNLVTFTMPNGTLGSLRGSELDLEASARMTAEAKAAAEAKARLVIQPPPPKEAVLVLTDKDVQHVDPETIAPPPAAGATGAEGAAAGAAAADAAPQGSVQIADWDKSISQADNGVMLTGTVTNRGSDTALAVTVTARLYDDAGKLLGTAPASLASEALPAGQSTRFTIVFPGILTFASVAVRRRVDPGEDRPTAWPGRFVITQLGLERRPAPASGAGARALCLL